jgi:16S rRNA G966 N2-methylase RsmD
VDDTARHVRTIGQFDVPERYATWLPLGAVVRRYLANPRFDTGRVAKIVRAADSALEWIDANADTLDRHEFTAWLDRQGEAAWDPKIIDGWLVDLIGRMRERQLTPEIRTGDFLDALADLPDGSVDLILTDPPYGDAAVPSYEALAEFAARKLKPGGSLICYTGQSILPDVYRALGEHLRYWWTISLDHQYGGQQLPGKWVMVEWKPIVWYVQDHRDGTEYVADKVRGSRPDKGAHEWAQGIEEVGYLIEQLTKPDHLVVDPFAGSGSFGRMALDLGRRFIGADLDPGSAEGSIVQ